jgi:hypothetical protein
MWCSVSPRTAITLSTDLGVASAVMPRKGRDRRQNQSRAEPEKNRAGRELTVCTAERGHGEHEPAVQVARPPEAAALPRVTTSARR